MRVERDIVGIEEIPAGEREAVAKAMGISERSLAKIVKDAEEMAEAAS